MILNEVDLLSVPVNIVNSLAKLVKNKIELTEVSSCCCPMLENIKCKELTLNETLPKLPTSTQNIIIGKVCLKDMDIFDVSIDGLLDIITCEELVIFNTRIFSAETRSLTKMLTNSVRKLGKG